ncbi:MAG: stilbene synthase [Planctomycetota bacterium]|nr:MAG: stilbene synthase [Planctomycetota bacterium]
MAAPVLASVATAFPRHYYSQDQLLAGFRRVWAGRLRHPELLERLHTNVRVRGRYLALPMERYLELEGFAAKNAAWIEVAVELGQRAVAGALERAGLEPAAVRWLVFTTVTGVAVPSIDARLMNRLAFSPYLERIPLFGIGCAGGAAGIARLASVLRGQPEQAAVLLAVELCSLTLRLDDLSLANLVATGLFGDGAAAVVMLGAQHPLAAPTSRPLPRIVAARAVFFPGTERLMGWEVGGAGLQIVLGPEVPEIARSALPPHVRRFLGEHGLGLEDVAVWVAHPGGPRVIEALEQGLGLGPGALELSRQSLAEVGNLSSASVLEVLQRTLAHRAPAPGQYGVLLAMGPGFSAELVLLRW